MDVDSGVKGYADCFCGGTHYRYAGQRRRAHTHNRRARQIICLVNSVGHENLLEINFED